MYWVCFLTSRLKNKNYRGLSFLEFFASKLKNTSFMSFTSYQKRQIRRLRRFFELVVEKNTVRCGYPHQCYEMLLTPQVLQILVFPVATVTTDVTDCGARLCKLKTAKLAATCCTSVSSDNKRSIGTNRMIILYMLTGKSTCRILNVTVS